MALPSADQRGRDAADGAPVIGCATPPPGGMMRISPSRSNAMRPSGAASIEKLVPRVSVTCAWASDQSEPVASREAMMEQLLDRAAELGVTVPPGDAAEIARPPHWGGYRVWPHRIELWIEGEDRIHDRARWERSVEPGEGDAFIVGAWSGTRLQP